MLMLMSLSSCCFVVVVDLLVMVSCNSYVLVPVFMKGQHSVVLKKLSYAVSVEDQTTHMAAIKQKSYFKNVQMILQ